MGAFAPKTDNLIDYLAATDTGNITGVSFKGGIEGIVTTQSIF